MTVRRQDSRLTPIRVEADRVTLPALKVQYMNEAEDIRFLAPHREKLDMRPLPNVCATAAVFALFTGSIQAQVIISEIVDGTLTGGQPKFVELTNCGADPVDLSAYSIGNFNNGGSELGGGASAALAGELVAGASLVIAYEAPPADGAESAFEAAFGDPPGMFIGPFINGDDVLVLFEGLATGDGSDATMVDVYGNIGVDGSDTSWEYTDSYVVRRPGSVPSSTFDETEWMIAGANALEGADDVEELQNLLDRTTPGAHVCEGGVAPTVPAASTWALGALALMLVFAGMRLCRTKPEVG